MVRQKILLLTVLCSCAALFAQDKPAPEKWGETITEFEQWDSKNTFPSDAVLFVGSSSIKLWPTRECFGEFPVLNRGFGGSQISDVNYFAERIVLRYEPKVIVFYAGDNDVAAGKNARRVFDDYKKFVKLIQTELSSTRIIYIGIKPSRHAHVGAIRGWDFLDIRGDLLKISTFHKISCCVTYSHIKHNDGF